MNGWLSLVVMAGLLAADDRELKFTGVVRDGAGNPLVGARVDVDTAAPRVGRGIFCPSCYLDCRKSATTGADGRFAIPIRDRSLKFRLLCAFSGMKPRLTVLLEPEAGDVVITLEPLPKNWPADQTLRGRILDDQGQPVPGALVQPYGAKTSEKRWWGRVEVDSAVSDHEGRFQMHLPAGYYGLDVQVRADGFAGATSNLLEPRRQEHEIVIPTGTKVTGKVVHNGQPVSALRIAVVQVERGTGDNFIGAVEDTTDAEGKFVFEYLPAGQPFVIYTLIDGSGPEYVLSTKRFSAQGSGQSRDLGALEVVPSLRLSGRVALLPGETLPPTARLALDRDPAWDLVAAPVKPDGSFEFVGIPPETYEMRMEIPRFTLDSTQLRYQQTRDHSFGIRIDRSVSDLAIPIVRSVAPAAAIDQQPKQSETKPGNRDVSLQKQSEPARPWKTVVRRTADPVPTTGPTITVQGVIVTPEGTPIDRATVVLRAKIGGQYYSSGVMHNRDVLARTTTDAEGRFRLGGVGIPPRMQTVIQSVLSAQFGGGSPAVELLAWAEDRALAFTDLNPSALSGEVRMTLRPEAEVIGIVKNAAGNGIPNVPEVLTGITPSTGDYSSMFDDPGDLNLVLSELALPLSAITDATGGFRLRHVPRDRRVRLMIRVPGYKYETLFVNTSANEVVQQMKSRNSSRGNWVVKKSPVDVVLEPARNVIVRVVDCQGRLVPHGAVQVIDAMRHGAGWDDVNEQGEAHLAITAAGSYEFFFATDPLQPTLGGSAKFDVPHGEDSPVFELRLAEPRWLSGRISDADTAQPVVGAYVWYSSEPADGGDRQSFSLSVSDADGNFRLPVAAGAGRAFIHELYGYMTSSGRDANDEDMFHKLNIPADGDIPPVEWKLARGLVVHGRCLDGGGKPVPGVTVRGKNTSSPWSEAVAETGVDGRFEIYGLSPYSNVLLSAASKEGGVRKVISGDPSHSWQKSRQVDVDLQFERAVALTGRVLRNGQARPGVRMRLYCTLLEPNKYMLINEVATNELGEYRMNGLQPGDRYYFEILTTDR